MIRGFSGTTLAIVGSLLIVLLLILLLKLQTRSGPGENATLVRVACAAGIKPPVLAAAEAYEETFGVTIELVYGGSATLLGGIEIKPDAADLYIAADDAYVEDGRQRGLLAESIPLAQLTPVIAVPTGNPKSIRSLEDLLTRDDLRIGLANPDAAAVGNATRELLSATGEWSSLEGRITVFKPTVVESANDVVLGAIDAAIVWDATAAQYDDLEAISIPQLKQGGRTIAVAVVAGTAQPTEALRFARYLASRDRGQPFFQAHGYEVRPGDLWSERPRIVIFAGSMFNQAVEETLQAFAEREGIDIERVYNGCGFLVGQMKAGAQPDAYLSCDTRFMKDVQERFHPSRTFSENPMVLITPSGNPAGITNINQLADGDLRVGLAHPNKSALGDLTQQLLNQRGLLEPIERSGNWVQQAPQGDFLVNAMRTGSLDAAIVYASNAAVASEYLEIMPIEAHGAVARQPWAIARSTDHTHTIERLFDQLAAEHSAERFRQLGFRWLPDHAGSAPGGEPR